MRHLEFIKPSGRGLGYALPSGQGFYLPLVSNYIPHHDDFLGSSLDSQEWVSSAGGTAVVSVTSSLATITGSTATAATISVKVLSAMTAKGNLYTVPFRVTYALRLSDLTSGQNTFIEVKDTGGTHLAHFHLSGTAKTVATGLSCAVQAGSTEAAYIATAVLNYFATAGLTPTAWNAYTIEMTHNGVAFAANTDVQSKEPPRLLQFFRTPLPRLDKVYYLQVRTEVASADAVAGTPNTVDVDYVEVEQLAPTVREPFFGQSGEVAQGAVKTYIPTATALAPTEPGGMVTSGAGVLLAVCPTTTATAGSSLYLAAYDSSGTGSAVYNFLRGSGLSTAISRLLWLQQVNIGATGGGGMAQATFPKDGIPFYRGLVIGDVAAGAAAVGASAITWLAVYKSE